MADELTILRLVAIKGRVPTELVAGSLGVDEERAQALLDDLVEWELVKQTPMGYRVTPAGRARCTEFVAAESKATDQFVVSAVYETFCRHNQILKEIIKDWQTRDEEPNDHCDADYDRQVLDRLIALHKQVLPLLDDVSAAAPRLNHYRTRLVKAAEAVAAGDVSFVSKPIVDSYHTVWFELHEDLIGLSGLTRQAEAEAGRGA